MSVSHRPLALNSSVSLSLCFHWTLVSSLLYSLSIPRVLHVKSINFVLYGWLEGSSKFLPFSTPSPSLSPAFSLRTQPTSGPQTRTHKLPVVPCLTCLIRGNQGRLWLSWRLICVLLSFSLSVYLSAFLCDSPHQPQTSLSPALKVFN